jgi:hypothetical protein
MKELLGILCATVSIVSAGIAWYYANKCSETEEAKKKKTEPEKDDAPTEFDCTCCEDCYGCCEDIDVDDIQDVKIDNEVPNEGVDDDEEVIPEVNVTTEGEETFETETDTPTTTDGEETED